MAILGMDRMLTQIEGMFSHFDSVDLSTISNVKIMLRIRDVLVESGKYTLEEANQVVSVMSLDVDQTVYDEYEERVNGLADQMARLMVKFAIMAEDNDFSMANILEMARGLSLSLKVNGGDSA